MSVDRVRHGRQMRLPEIGERGQARLAAQEVELGGGGFVGEVESLYLTRAGLRVRERAACPSRTPSELAGLEIRHSAAHELAEGALRALVAMHAALAARGDP